MFFSTKFDQISFFSKNTFCTENLGSKNRIKNLFDRKYQKKAQNKLSQNQTRITAKSRKQCLLALSARNRHLQVVSVKIFGIQ